MLIDRGTSSHAFSVVIEEAADARQGDERRRMLASLPWYDLPELACATDALWKALARRLRSCGLGDVPSRLNRTLPYQHQWRSRRFLFGQCCGYDVRITHPRRLRLLATPCYAAPGCHGGTYSSFVIVREDRPVFPLEDLRGLRCAVNTLSSHSGMNVLRAIALPLSRGGRFFGGVVLSGSHENSLSLVLRGAADVAAIDCITYALLKRYRPQAVNGIRVLHRTGPAAAPPYVTGAAVPGPAQARLREALAETFGDPALADVREALFIKCVQRLPLAAYESIAELARRARQQGYNELERLCRPLAGRRARTSPAFSC